MRVFAKRICYLCIASAPNEPCASIMCTNPEDNRFTPVAYNDFLKKNLSVHHDLKTLYEQACRELTLQQEKRDKTISIYVAVIAFLVPFLFSSQSAVNGNPLPASFAGWVLVIAGFIGVFFSVAVIRYRVYKEVYWITCRVITQMQNYSEELYKKKNIQSLFLHCLEKKWAKYMAAKDYCYNPNADKVGVRYGKLVKENMNSAEFCTFACMALIASVLIAFGLSLVVGKMGCAWPFISLGALVLFLLAFSYFRSLANVFRVLSDHHEDSFNYAFGKAWFLHIYPD